MMKSSRRGYAAGIGMLVVLIAVAIGLYLMFGNLGGSNNAGAGAAGPSTPANITKVNPISPPGATSAGGAGSAAGAGQPATGGSTTGGSYVGNVLAGKRRGEDTAQHIYLTEIARLVAMYELDNGKYPTTMDELVEFTGDDGAWMLDPWGKAYTFKVDKPSRTVRIASDGPDNQANTGDEEAFDVKLPM